MHSRSRRQRFRQTTINTVSNHHWIVLECEHNSDVHEHTLMHMYSSWIRGVAERHAYTLNDNFSLPCCLTRLFVAFCFLQNSSPNCCMYNRLLNRLSVVRHRLKGFSTALRKGLSLTCTSYETWCNLIDLPKPWRAGLLRSRTRTTSPPLGGGGWGTVLWLPSNPDYSLLPDLVRSKYFSGRLIGIHSRIVKRPILPHFISWNFSRAPWNPKPVQRYSRLSLVLTL